MEAFPLYLGILPFVLVLHAAAGNVSIDDQNGDELTGTMPSYSPSSNWEQGATCTGCYLQPNISLAFDQTWHDSTYDAVRRPGIPTINLFFNGASTAIYVFCIQGNNVAMNLTFTLDGQPVGGYTYSPPNNDTGFQYNTLVYSNEALSSPASGSQHALIIQSYAVNLFDYAIYTIPDNVSKSSSGTIPISSSSPALGSPSASGSSTARKTSTPIGGIVGGVVGGVFVLLVVFVIIWFYRRPSPSESADPSSSRPRFFWNRNNDDQALHIEPFYGSPSAPSTTAASTAPQEELVGDRRKRRARGKSKTRKHGDERHKQSTPRRAHRTRAQHGDESAAEASSSSGPHTDSSERQGQLRDQIQDVQSRIDTLQGSRIRSSEITEMKEELRSFREQLEELRNQDRARRAMMVVNNEAALTEELPEYTE